MMFFFSAKKTQDVRWAVVGYEGQKKPVCWNTNKTLTKKRILFILFMPTLASKKGKSIIISF